MAKKVYFEKQSYFSLQCGLFSVNHLLGGKVYSKTDFNNICYSLSDDTINPHKHLFGGDYDVNVLIIALQQQGYEVKWFDRRKEHLNVNTPSKEAPLIGYLVNVYSSGAPNFIHKLCNISKRHWFAVRRYGDEFCWLDSKMDEVRWMKPENVEVELNHLLTEREEEGERT